MFMRAMPLLCAFALLLSSGCATWVKRADRFPEQRPARALLASFEVSVEQREGGPNLLDLVQNDSVKDFGDTAYPILSEALQEEGIELFLEKERAVAFEQVWKGPGNRFTALTGRWQHPDTASVSLAQFRSLIHLGPNAARDKVKAVAKEHEADLYAFVSMTVLEDVGFSINDMVLWGMPKLALDIVTIDSSGQTVYDARVIGEGHGSPFIVDRTPDNLRVALRDALARLKAHEEKPLE